MVSDSAGPRTTGSDGAERLPPSQIYKSTDPVFLKTDQGYKRSGRRLIGNGAAEARACAAIRPALYSEHDRGGGVKISTILDHIDSGHFALPEFQARLRLEPGTGARPVRLALSQAPRGQPPGVGDRGEDGCSSRRSENERRDLRRPGNGDYRCFGARGGHGGRQAWARL